MNPNVYSIEKILDNFHRVIHILLVLYIHNLHSKSIYLWSLSHERLITKKQFSLILSYDFFCNAYFGFFDEKLLIWWIITISISCNMSKEKKNLI
jgi:hypothetical protein